MDEIIVSNTSPLIWLGKIDALHLLPSLFQDCIIEVPQEVLDEIEDYRINKAVKDLIDEKKIILLPSSLKLYEQEVRSIAINIAMMATQEKARDPKQHYPESLVIHLGDIKSAKFLVLDEKNARTIAKQKGLACVSHFDIIRRCVEKEVISKSEGIRLLEELLKKGHFAKGKIQNFIEKWSI